jgi:hypothetical protein
MDVLVLVLGLIFSPYPVMVMTSAMGPVVEVKRSVTISSTQIWPTTVESSRLVWELVVLLITWHAWFRRVSTFEEFKFWVVPTIKPLKMRHVIGSRLIVASAFLVKRAVRAIQRGGIVVR